MFIEINSEDRDIPTITIKRDRESNLIKKSEIKYYKDAKKLLDSLELRVDDYQRFLEIQVLNLITEKEKILNNHIQEIFYIEKEKLEKEKVNWEVHANDELHKMIENQNEFLNDFKNELQKSIISRIQDRILQLTQNESLISLLSDILHHEINDENKSLNIKKEAVDDGMQLTIENDDQIMVINTSSLLGELKDSLEQI